MTYTNEIVLFHVRDPAPAVHFTDISGDTLFTLCVRSIRARSPHSRITLLTDGTTEMGSDYPGVEVIRDHALKTEYLMYERARMYGEHVARRANETDAMPLVFMDTDILVNRDLGEVFALPFDVGLTCRVRPGVVLNSDGIPTNTKVSPINGGVILARPTSAATAFFKEQMVRYDALHARGGIPSELTPVQDIRKWGGDQFALMNMVGRVLLEEQPELIEHAGAQVRFMDCNIYNYSPEPGVDLTPAMLTPKFIIHMKGRFKTYMPTLAQALGIG
jgi:Nucleotide-diphospho-sugar transferase